MTPRDCRKFESDVISIPISRDDPPLVAVLAYDASIDDNEVLVIAFSGDYPDGSLGRKYAMRMIQISNDILRRCDAKRLVIDLSNLDYRWGDEMEWIYSIDRNVPQSTVVSHKNRRALSTLEWGLQTSQDITELDDVFNSFDDAVAYVSKK